MDDEGDILIRQIKEEELQDLVQVYQSAYQRMGKYAYRSKEKVKGYLRWLYRGDPEGFWVAEKEGKLIGFVSIHSEWEDWRWGRTGELHELAVEKIFQGKGVGKKLFARALRYARERGCRTLSLWVGEENWLARNWYQKLGFKEKGSWGDWVRMKKNLSFPEVEEMDEDTGKNS